MTWPDGGGLTVEFYKSATTFARDTFGWWIVLERGRGVKKREGVLLTAGTGTITWKVCYNTLVASLFGGGGACR